MSPLESTRNQYCQPYLGEDAGVLQGPEVAELVARRAHGQLAGLLIADVLPERNQK